MAGQHTECLPKLNHPIGQVQYQSHGDRLNMKINRLLSLDQSAKILFEH